MEQIARRNVAALFLPFLMSCTRTHLRMAELGCFASTPTFSSTIPLACDEPPVGDERKAVPSALFLKCSSAQRASLRSRRSLRAACRPRGLLTPVQNTCVSSVSRSLNVDGTHPCLSVDAVVDGRGRSLMAIFLGCGRSKWKRRRPTIFISSPTLVAHFRSYSWHRTGFSCRAVFSESRQGDLGGLTAPSKLTAAGSTIEHPVVQLSVDIPVRELSRVASVVQDL